jgi:type IV pilus assembly protein PilM
MTGNGGRPAFGIDIGSRLLKVVAAHSKADNIGLEAAEAIRVPQNCVERGIVKDVGALSRAVRSHLDAQCISPGVATISVPSSLAVLRWITLPVLAGDDLREAARFKVKKHLPFSVDSAYIEASDPISRAGEDNAEYLVIAVPREVIDSRSEAMELAGFLPSGAELEAQAILRVVERRLREKSPLWRDASLTLIDVGAANTHMYVVQNQRLQFLRGVRFGSDGFSAAVAEHLSTTRDEADSLLCLPSTEIASDGILRILYRGGEVRIGVQADLDKLTREFLRLLRYFRSLHPERSYAGILDHLLLCGGLAGMKGFAEYLEGQLGLRVERARPFTGMIGRFSKDSFESISTRQEAYTVATGLALSALAGCAKKRGDNSAGREYVWARGA